MTENILYEKFKQKLKKKTPQYDDELEELEKENFICGSKENNQKDKLTMKEKNSLEELLYGDTQGKRTFSNFRKEGEGLTERTKEKRPDTLQKQKREKKIDKLSTNKDHWKGLE